MATNEIHNYSILWQHANEEKHILYDYDPHEPTLVDAFLDNVKLAFVRVWTEDMQFEHTVKLHHLNEPLPIERDGSVFAIRCPVSVVETLTKEQLKQIRFVICPHTPILNANGFRIISQANGVILWQNTYYSVKIQKNTYDTVTNEKNNQKQLVQRHKQSQANTIDVVVCCHNYEEYLPDCLHSIKAQTYPATNIIVVDDSSEEPDLIKQVCGVFGAIYVRCDVADGCKARDLGLRIATSEYVVFFDADDYMLNAMLFKLIQPVLSNPNIGIVYGGAVKLVDDLLSDSFVAIAKCTLSELQRRNYIPAPSLLRRHAVLMAGGWSYGGGVPKLQDWSMMLRITALGYLHHHVHETVFVYRQHAQQITKTVSNTNTHLPVLQLQQFAVATCFSGRVSLANAVSNYSRLGIDPSQLHGVFVNNSPASSFDLGLLRTVCRNWRSVTLVNVPQQLPDVSTLALRQQYKEALGWHLVRLYATELRQHLPTSCQFVLTLEDDVEVLGENIIPRLLLPMQTRVDAVTAPVRSRFGDNHIMSHHITSTSPLQYKNAVLNGDVNVPVDSTGFGCTLWRKQCWDYIPLYPSVNDEHNLYWQDMTFCVNLKDKLKNQIILTPTVTTRHWHTDTQYV